MSSLSSGPAPQLRHRVPRMAEAAVERARLTVVPHRRVRAARVPFVSLVSVVLLGGVIGLLLFNTQMQQASFAATALTEQADNLAAREQTLTMEVERLRDPQQIALRATELGMVVAATPAFVDLDTGTVVGVRRPAGEEGRLPLHGRVPPPPGAAPAPAAGTSAGAEARADAQSGAAPGRDTGREDADRGDRQGRTSHESQQSHDDRDRSRSAQDRR